MISSSVQRGADDLSASTLHLELLLAYEDAATARRAKCAVERVLRSTEVKARSKFHLCKLDLLDVPELRRQAAQEAAAADLLIVSIHGNRRLPNQAESNVIEWVGVMRAKPCALVISLDAGAQLRTENPTVKELRSAAAHHGVAVMFHFGDRHGSQ